MEDVVSHLDYFKTWFSVDISEQVALKVEKGTDMLIFQLFGRILGKEEPHHPVAPFFGKSTLVPGTMHYAEVGPKKKKIRMLTVSFLFL